jgi:hypothetical protein
LLPIWELNPKENSMKIAKALVAALGGLCTVLAPVLADNVIGAGEWPGVLSALVLAAGTVAAVWRVPNKPGTDVPTPPVPPVVPPVA